MWYWSLKSLFAEPLRLISGSLGVACAFLLVMVFQAVFEGESRQIVAYIQNTDADVWVMQDGVENMHMASSLLWNWKAPRIARIAGVTEVASILYMNTVMSAGGKRWFSYIVGVDENAFTGGAWEMTAGEAWPQQGEAIVPDVVAILSGLSIGDTVQVLDAELRIVGLSRGTFSMANSVTFINKKDLSRLMDAGEAVSYILVKGSDGISAQDLAARIKTGVDKVSALPKQQFIHRDREMALQMGSEIIRIMITIGTLLAVLIAGFTVYYQVIHKQRELALAKALGFRHRHIYAGVFLQAAAINALGYGLAVAGAYTLMPMIPLVAPQISLYVSVESLVRLGVIGILVTTLVVFVLARNVTRVDPVTVFQR